MDDFLITAPPKTEMEPTCTGIVTEIQDVRLDISTTKTQGCDINSSKKTSSSLYSGQVLELSGFLPKTSNHITPQNVLTSPEPRKQPVFPGGCSGAGWGKGGQRPRGQWPPAGSAETKPATDRSRLQQREPASRWGWDRQDRRTGIPSGADRAGRWIAPTWPMASGSAETKPVLAPAEGVNRVRTARDGTEGDRRDPIPPFLVQSARIKSRPRMLCLASGVNRKDPNPLLE
ncbi:uncharacterized protein LOC115908813 [Camarhynchus parvulus]|uniref:uncharacterized protein LOC115908813 n=1 Tax=Geospiza parvula TaxID=87175 RepID=UPI001237B4B4|nr:uncharacterized protein LOC115908813 [Camarhynchus parvulus]